MQYKSKKSLDQWANQVNTPIKPVEKELKRLSVLIEKEDYQTIIKYRIKELLLEEILEIDDKQMNGPNISSYIRYLIKKDLKK